MKSPIKPYLRMECRICLGIGKWRRRRHDTTYSYLVKVEFCFANSKAALPKESRNILCRSSRDSTWILTRYWPKSSGLLCVWVQDINFASNFLVCSFNWPGCKMCSKEEHCLKMSVWVQQLSEIWPIQNLLAFASLRSLQDLNHGHFTRGRNGNHYSIWSYFRKVLYDTYR